MDPLAEKKHFVSSYIYCLVNPIRYIDPDGRDEEQSKVLFTQNVTIAPQLSTRVSPRVSEGINAITIDQPYGETFTGRMSNGSQATAKHWGGYNDLGEYIANLLVVKAEHGVTELLYEVAKGVNEVVDHFSRKAEKQVTMKSGDVVYSTISVHTVTGDFQSDKNKYNVSRYRGDTIEIFKVTTIINSKNGEKTRDTTITPYIPHRLR